MAWWGPGFSPVFDLDDIRNDIEIIENAIPKLEARIPIDEQTEADHKTIWSFWNPLCNNVDYYIGHCNGRVGRQGPLEDSNVVNMAAGNYDAVIYQNDNQVPNNDGEDLYFGSSPNPLYLGGAYNGPLVDPAPDSEISQLGVELSYAGYGNLDPIEVGLRQDACNAQVATIAAEVGILTSIITDCEDGEATYPVLTAIKDFCVAAIGRASSASGRAGARALVSSAYSGTQIQEITDRQTEAENDASTINGLLGTYVTTWPFGKPVYTWTAGSVRHARYSWTDVRCNASYGSLSTEYGNPVHLQRMIDEKARLEALLAAYETL